MTNPHYPPRLRSKADRARFDRVVSDLRRHDLDAESRAELIADFVELDRQVANLRKDAKGGSIATRMAATRALNVSTAERRRLHQRLFAGGKQHVDELPLAIGESPADAAWRAYHHYGDVSMSVEQLTARYGECTWPAILFATHAEAVEADEAIERSIRLEGSRGAARQRISRT